ncbi:MAG: zinc-ribbon domain-containing protein [Armatimonadota bacterium]|nr:hypothetical protein [bacterium]
MYCAKCGKELPKGEKKCPQCGMVNEYVDTTPKRRKISPVVYAIIALAVISVVAVVFAVTRGRGGDVVTAPAPTQAPSGALTTAPPGTGAPGGLTQAPPGNPGLGDQTPSHTPKPKPPQSVTDYLAFVKRVEEIREAAIVNKDISTIAGSALEAIVGQMSGDSASSRDDELSKSADAMYITLKTFDRATAPAECREFSANYRQLLYVETDALYQVSSMLNNLSADSKASWSKMRTDQARIKQNMPKMNTDAEQLVKDSDSALDRLIGNYDMQKPFTVQSEDAGGGSITDVLPKTRRK